MRRAAACGVGPAHSQSKADGRLTRTRTGTSRRKCGSLACMSKQGSVLLWSVALALGVGLDARVARAEVPDTPAWQSNVGFVSGIGLAVLVPDEGSVGFGLEPTGRYGIPAGPVIVAPGARLGGYYVSERLIGTLMPTLRLTVPLGPLAPFGQGGIGAGGLTNPGEGGLAWLAGGGLMIHFGGVLAIGAEVNYQGITETDYKALSIGPSIIIGG